MNVFTAEKLSKSFSERPLFTDISISLSEGQKMAIIAPNGSGKSTLLRIIAGREQADTGSVSKRSDLKIGYLEQEPGFIPGMNALDSIFPPDHPLLHAIGSYERLLEEGDKADPLELQRLTDYIDSNQGWDYESKAAEVLGKLGIHDLEREVSTFSGGQKKRLALARLLIENHDLLLLDEPTNHLDLDMIEWLENYLSAQNKPMLLISHDRYFIDGVCDSIAELQPDKLYIYKGGYSYFLEKKGEREQAERASVEKARNIYARELEWMRRQPKARGTKQKARQDNFYEIEQKAKAKVSDSGIEMTMQMNRLGSRILELENVCKKYDDRILFENFSYTFKRGEKIGIIGKNGSGKSTLLNMIMGQVKPDAGRIRAGETVVFGYFSQEGMRLNEDMRVLDAMKEIAEYVETGNGNWITVSQFLNLFRFEGSRQHTFISRLSGGEKKRLYLITLLLRNPNFLILDEPTNDLDIATLNTLEDFLAGYQGCLLMVTHDRYFMDRLVDHVFVLDGNGKVKDIHGNYTDYRSQFSRESDQQSDATVKPERKKIREKKKLSFKEQKELEEIEKSIQSLEDQKGDLIAKMNAVNLSHEELTEISNRYREVEKELESKTMRWMEIQESIQ